MTFNGVSGMKKLMLAAVALSVLGLTPDRSEAGFLKRIRDRRASACAAAPVAAASQVTAAVRVMVAGGACAVGVCPAK